MAHYFYFAEQDAVICCKKQFDIKSLNLVQAIHKPQYQKDYTKNNAFTHFEIPTYKQASDFSIIQKRLSKPVAHF